MTRLPRRAAASLAAFALAGAGLAGALASPEPATPQQAAPALTLTPAAPAPASGEDLAERLRTRVKAVQAEGCPEDLGPALAETQERAFEAILVSGRRLVLQTFLRCAVAAKDWEAAAGLADQLAPIAEAAGGIHRLRFELAMERKAWVAAADALIETAHADGAALNEVRARSVGWLLRQLRLAGERKRLLAVHDALGGRAWSPPDTLAPPQWPAVEHARLLLKDGATPLALDRLLSVRDSAALIEVAIDRAFAPAWEPLARKGRFRWREGAEADLAVWRERLKEHPDSLEAALRVMGLLRMLGRSQEAVELGEAQRAKLKDQKAFRDFEERAAWLVNELAYASYETGQPEKGRALLREAAALKELGQSNVSQVINRGVVLVFEGRPEEARAAMDALDAKSASDFGQYWAHTVEACAAAQLGETAALNAALAALRADLKVNPGATMTGLLCADALDEAAALYLSRLADEDDRGGALEAAQNSADANPMKLRYLGLLQKRFEAVIARPEVADAIDRHGRVLDIPLRETYWGGF